MSAISQALVHEVCAATGQEPERVRALLSIGIDPRKVAS